MPRGRKPAGETPLSNAERQAQYRSRHQGTQAAAVVRGRRQSDRRSRLQRWRDAVAELLGLAMPLGSRQCLTRCSAPPRPKPCKPLSISIWRRSPASSHRAGMVVTDRTAGFAVAPRRR